MLLILFEEKAKLVFRVNLGVVLFLGAGWLYFYWFILSKNIEKIPYAMIVNPVIFGLNLLFVVSLVLLPVSYRRRK